MRVLHLLKTNDGAAWALWQAAELVKLGVEVHAVLPTRVGKWSRAWEESGVHLTHANIDFPVRQPWLLGAVSREFRAIIDRLKPD